jgi:PIN domain nuclease of toxin-antitoxin system
VTALLDTHVWWWWVNGDRRPSRAQQRVLRRISEKNPILISDISLWEVATLTSLGRLEVTVPLREWLERAAAEPLVRRCHISPAIAAEVAALPDSFSRDPADRVIVATARVHGATLLTRDSRIIESQLVPTLV